MSVSHLSFDYLLGAAVWLAAGLLALFVLLKLRRRWKERKRLKTAANVGLSLWMLLFLLTLIEAWFATAYDQSDSFNMTNVSKKWFDLHVKPDEKTILFNDGQGERYRDDREFPKQIPADRTHVCFLGDSFTFGHGVKDVSDRFSNRVRDALERDFPDRFLVTNLSKPGSDLFWVEGMLEHLFADGRRVDVVVYVMCLNDVETFHRDPNRLSRNIGSAGPEFFLFQHTYFLNFLYFRVQQVSQPAVGGYYSEVLDYYDGEPWERMQRKFLAVRDLCRRNDADFRVVVFPFLHNLGADYPFRGVHGRVVSHCESAGIPVLDLDPVLSPHVGEGLTVNPFDAHPNERAHAIAAEAIREKLLNDLTEAPESGFGQ